jgi:AcrR family transcriptional regulator
MVSPALSDLPSARERVLDAAESRLLAGGPSALVLDAVARDAGVSKGGLLYHFPSKTALVDGLVERMLDGFEQSQALRAQADAGAGRWTRAYLNTTVDSEGGPADSSGQLMAGILACIGRDAERLATVGDAFARWQRRLEDDGLDPATATLVRLAADGLWLSQLLGLPRVDQPLLRQVLDGLRDRTKA